MKFNGVKIVGPHPSSKSGIARYTERLATLLDITPIYFGNMVPGFLRKLVKKVNLAGEVSGTINWYACRTWKFTPAECYLLNWWTASVAHIYLWNLLVNRHSRYVLLKHEELDPFEQKILPIRIYGKVMLWVLEHLVDVIVTHKDIPHPLYHYPEYKDAKEYLNLEGYIILAPGLVRDYKGTDILIKAFLDKCFIEDSVLVIAGEWWDDPTTNLSDTERLFFDIYVKRGIIVIEDRYLSDEDFGTYLSAADVVVLPYQRNESSGIVKAAMAHRKQIVASECLEDDLRGYNGYILCSNEHIMNAIDDIYAQPFKNITIPKHLSDENIKAKWEEILKPK